ncbi:MAG: hypothetical protein RL766_1527, partial [Bacteroidota bacterium]
DIWSRNKSDTNEYKKYKRIIVDHFCFFLLNKTSNIGSTLKNIEK